MAEPEPYHYRYSQNVNSSHNLATPTTPATQRYHDYPNTSAVSRTPEKTQQSSYYITNVVQPVQTTWCGCLFSWLVCLVVSFSFLVTVAVALLLLLPESIIDDMASKLADTFGMFTVNTPTYTHTHIRYIYIYIFMYIKYTYSHTQTHTHIYIYIYIYIYVYA